MLCYFILMFYPVVVLCFPVTSSENSPIRPSPSPWGLRDSELHYIEARIPSPEVSPSPEDDITYAKHLAEYIANYIALHDSYGEVGAHH